MFQDGRDDRMSHVGMGVGETNANVRGRRGCDSIGGPFTHGCISGDVETWFAPTIISILVL